MRILFLLAFFVSTNATSRAYIPITEVPEQFIEIASTHIGEVAKSQLADWRGARIVSVSELFRNGVKSPAYYEFNVYIGNEPAGFVVVSSGEHDFVIPHWKTTGLSPAETLANKYGRSQIRRLLKVDVFAYGAELKSGKIVEVPADRSKSSFRLEYEASLAAAASADWKRFKSHKNSKEDDDWTIFRTPDPSPKYNQFKAGVGPNTSGCLSGCGATAWAILFGWADIQANSNEKWKKSWGIYREGGGRGEDIVAPEEMTAGVENITWEIRNQIGTWCYSGEGATGPWNMLKAKKYLSGRTEATIEAKYNVFGKSEDRIKKFAIASIRNSKTPSIIGIGWLKHYPVAKSYAFKADKESKKLAEWFYVNQGWGGTGDDWVAAGTWFAGVIRPAR